MTVRLQITKKQINTWHFLLYSLHPVLLNFFLFFQGLKHDSDDKVHLGYFTYDINGSPTQTFEVIQKVNK